MKKSAWKIYLVFIAIAEAVGALAALIGSDAMKIYADTINKPPLSPPAILFPIVWTILYALMGVSSARIYMSGKTKARDLGLKIYFVQLIFNFLWSIFFFNFQAFGFAFVWIVALWLLILYMIILFSKTDKIAAYLQIPYLIWVTFAAYLNLGVRILN